MKTLTEQFEQILLEPLAELGDFKSKAEKLIHAVKERDKYIIGEDEPLTDNISGESPLVYIQKALRLTKNAVKEEQRKRAKETL